MKPESSRRYVVVGLGGVGGLVLRLLVPFLHQHEGRSTVLCIDGDTFEERNRARMFFDELGPKATVLARELAAPYGDRVNLLPVDEYLTPQRAGRILRDGDVVFCTPDNHASRFLLERRCRRLSDVALFSGGNDGVEEGRTGTFGNVQIYLRADGRDVTNPLSAYHPEIATPGEKPPTQQGCGAALASAPQLLFTNAAVASALVGAFYAWREGALDYEEAYLDVLTGRHVPVRRNLLGGA
ncbi:MAG: ThiF family adenylyltransferase [Deltaproteobacteria bacterium]|nr:ThiF family adenylyltransferase [Deltaproteobacteria bacterium]MBW2392846.1 ThiF family adenylyltransferase [Deltaproteobacteria bacterium]